MKAKEIIKKFNNSKSLDHLIYLKNRWLDEKEYEDFAEYQNAITKTLKNDGFQVIKKLTKRFILIIIGSDHNVKIQLNAKELKIWYYKK